MLPAPLVVLPCTTTPEPLRAGHTPLLLVILLVRVLLGPASFLSVPLPLGCGRAVRLRLCLLLLRTFLRREQEVGLESSGFGCTEGFGGEGGLGHGVSGVAAADVEDEVLRRLIKRPR